MKKYLFAILMVLPGITFAQTANHLKISEAFLEVSGVKAGFTNIVDDVIKSQSGQIPKDYQENK